MSRRNFIRLLLSVTDSSASYSQLLHDLRRTRSDRCSNLANIERDNVDEARRRL